MRRRRATVELTGDSLNVTVPLLKEEADRVVKQGPKLTRREEEIIALLRQARSNKEIAAALNISIRTVRFHTHTIYVKHNVGNRTQLTRLLGYTD